MTSKGNNLPYEVLSNIFQHFPHHIYYDDDLNQTTLSQCALTCRSWRIPAQELLFKHILLVGKKDVLKAKRILKDKRNNFLLGIFVRRVGYQSLGKGGASYESELRKSFGLIDTLFPHLESIYYSPDVQVEKSFCILYDMIIGCKFKSLEQLPFDEDEGFDEYEDSDDKDIDQNQGQLHKKCVQLVERRKTAKSVRSHR